MRSSIHFIFTAVLAGALFPFFGRGSLIVFLSGWLIDADHFLLWVVTRRNLHIGKFYHYHMVESERNNYRSEDGNLHLAHTIEFLALAVIAAFLHPLALVFLIGLLGHYLLDAIWLAAVPKRIILNHSVIWWIVANKIRGNGGKREREIPQKH